MIVLQSLCWTQTYVIWASCTTYRTSTSTIMYCTDHCTLSTQSLLWRLEHLLLGVAISTHFFSKHMPQSIFALVIVGHRDLLRVVDSLRQEQYSDSSLLKNVLVSFVFYNNETDTRCASTKDISQPSPLPEPLAPNGALMAISLNHMNTFQYSVLFPHHITEWILLYRKGSTA